MYFIEKYVCRFSMNSGGAWSLQCTSDLQNAPFYKRKKKRKKTLCWFWSALFPWCQRGRVTWCLNKEKEWCQKWGMWHNVPICCNDQTPLWLPSSPKREIVGNMMQSVVLHWMKMKTWDCWHVLSLWKYTWWSYSWLDGLGKWCKSDVIWCWLAIWRWVSSLNGNPLDEDDDNLLDEVVLERICSWWRKYDVSSVCTEGNEEIHSECAQSMMKTLCLYEYAGMSKKNVISRVWKKRSKSANPGARGIEGSWYCFGPWYWKRINLYKEKKFIVQIMSVGERCLVLNEYFSVKYICMERVKVWW